MSYRTRTLAASLTIIASIYGCASSSSVPEAAARADGNAASRLSDLAVAPATRRLHSATTWIYSELRPSPDGRYVSMTYWSTGDLALYDLRSDSTLRLTRKAAWGVSNDFAETSVISPDGKSVAYGWYTDSRLSFDMKVMSLSGADSGNTKTILEGGPMVYTAAQAWTPDGRNVVGVVEGTSTYIVVVPVNGGSAKRVKTFESGFPDNIAVSPDAKWLAYDVATDDETSDRDVFVLALDGTAESIVSKEKGDDFVVGWSRDGSRILYGSERGGTVGVWAVAMLGGKPSGQPVLVRSDMLRMYPLGITKAGGIMYGVNTGTSDVFLASMNATTGELTSRPTAMNGPSNMIASSLAWSPDGQHLASVVVRGAGSRGVGPSDILIRSIERGEVRRLSPKMRRITFLYWAPDGSSLIVRGTDMNNKWGIYAVDLKSARMRTIAQSSEPGFGRNFSLATTGKSGYFVSADSAFRKFSVTRIDLATGGRQVLYTVNAPQAINGMAISPDGSQLGIAIRGGAYGNGVVALLPATGGAPREIFRFGDSESIPLNAGGGFAWSKEGKDLVFGVTQTSDSNNDRIDVRALSLADGKLRSLHIPAGKIANLRISPDSRRVAYFVWDPSSELWMMDEPVFDLIRSAAVHR